MNSATVFIPLFILATYLKASKPVLSQPGGLMAEPPSVLTAVAAAGFISHLPKGFKTGSVPAGRLDG
jgi:hypothetical protein